MRRRATTTHHRQPTIKGTHRIPRSAAMLPELDSALLSEMDEYSVSRSWITAVALARHLDLPLPRTLDYRAMPWKKKADK